jgi:hypothetical protein
MKLDLPHKPYLKNPSRFRISVMGTLRKSLIDQLSTMEVEEVDDPTGITVSVLSNRLPGECSLVSILNALQEQRLPLLGVERLGA